MRRLAGSSIAGFASVVVLGFAAGAGALALLAFLAEDVAERESQAMDDAVLTWVHGFASPGLDLAARLVSALGSEVLAGVALVLLAFLAVRRHWRQLLLLAITLTGAQLLNDVLKQLFQRSRPVPVTGWIAAQAYSFPSGHATMSAAFYLFVACLLWRLLSPGWRPLLVVGTILLIGAIGVSRVYLQAHYPTDVAAGYAAGFIWTDAVLIGGQLLRRGPVHPHPT